MIHIPSRMAAGLALAAIVLAPPRLDAQTAPIPAGTLVVAGMNDDSVWFIDLRTGERRAVVETRTAPHEVAISGDGRLAAVTNYGDQQRGPGNLVQVLDVAAGVVTGEWSVEGYQRLHGVAFLPGDSLLALTSEQTAEILVVGVEDGEIRRTLPTEGRASHMLALGGPWIYTANVFDGTLSRVDPTGATPTRVWAAGTRTEGVAATPDGAQGWTASMDGGEVVGIDGDTGEVAARVTGLEVPYRLGVTTDGTLVVVSDPEAHALVLIDREAGTVRARVDVRAAAEERGLGSTPSPQGFTLSPDGRWAFVSTKGIDRVAVVDLAEARVVDFLPSGAGPDGIGYSPVVREGGEGAER